MTKSMKTIITIVVLIILIGGGWFFYSKVRPTEEEIAGVSNKVLVVPTDILSNSTIDNLKNFRQNGTLPITVTPEEKGRDNPFASF